MKSKITDVINHYRGSTAYLRSQKKESTDLKVDQ